MKCKLNDNICPCQHVSHNVPPVQGLNFVIKARITCKRMTRNMYVLSPLKIAACLCTKPDLYIHWFEL